MESLAMNLGERIHVLHRAWRLRLRSERHEMAFMRRCDLSGKTVLDIGANKGAYSYWMHRQAGPSGQVIAFEPQPMLVRYLTALRRAFGLNRMKIVNQALSAEAGSRSLTCVDAQSGLASLEQSWRGGQQELEAKGLSTQRVEVSTTTLDSYFEENPPTLPIGFIKCDVEGHELDVFRGGRETLTRHRPTLLFESYDFWPKQQATFDYLVGLGYEGYRLAGNGLLPLDEYAEKVGTSVPATPSAVFIPRAA